MAEGVATLPQPRPLLRLKAIAKAFGPVKALRGVSLDVFPGQVHALIGENGAGKSTLMKVLSGAHDPDVGTVELDGQPLVLANPSSARQAGIAMIYQELTLAPHLTVEENITLGLERSRFGLVQSQSGKVAEALDLLGREDIAPGQKVQSLTIARQQVVEIARAIVSDARIVIMDEPTSSLSEEDKQALFRVIRNLREKGMAVIYISHFLDEIDEIADRYTVLRDGESVGEGMVAESTIESLVEQMIGRKLKDMYPRPSHELGKVVATARAIGGRPLPQGVGFELREGEILGVFGLVGAGRTELARCLFGLDEVQAGTLELRGDAPLNLRNIHPVQALRCGLDYLSENRKDEGLAQNLSIRDNITLSAIRKTSRCGFLKLREEDGTAAKWVDKLGVRCSSAGQPVRALSGGNQQKVAIARMLHHDSQILIMDEPTRGIDVGSKHEIYELIHDLAAQGKSILVISSYLPELTGICHTLAVMHRGALSEVRAVDTWSDREVIRFATTGKTTGSAA
ncbi:sugar ABC transporter ATP-binding protein [Verrucomicrobiales bacterium]|nr:sugar ABC transporter ATP-binding protein [Verrucomicrobiales bacterium]